MTSQELIVITGSSGLIGFSLCERLAELGYKVVALDRQGPPHPPKHVETLDFDLTKEASVDAAFDTIRSRFGTRIAAVVHLAAYYDFTGGSSEKYEQITVRGTERLLKALKKFQVEQFIFSSTMLVHAPCQPGQTITEDWPLRPTWEYPKSKVQTEQLIRHVSPELPSVMMRIAGVYDDECHSIPIAHQIQRIYEKKPTSYFFSGDPSHGQTFVHHDDLTDAFVELIARRKKLPPILPLLIGEPKVVSYGELQRRIGETLHGKPWPTIRVPKPLAMVGAAVMQVVPIIRDPFIKPWMIRLADDHYALDITRARNLLGWNPKRSLAATLPLMLTKLKEDPQRWYKENHLTP